MTYTIDSSVMAAATIALAEVEDTFAGDIHTVTLTLNGQHGGADLLIEGDLDTVRRVIS